MTAGSAPVFGLFATNDVRERGRPVVLSRTPEDSLDHHGHPLTSSLYKTVQLGQVVSSYCASPS